MVVLAAVVAVFAAPPTWAQSGIDWIGEVEIEDAIALEVLGRDLIAYDSVVGGVQQIRLGLDEELIWSSASGQVAMALTSRRVLGLSLTGDGWQERNLKLREVVLGRPMLGKRVGLIVTSHRALGFDGRSGRWVESSIGPNESLRFSDVASGTAVFVTDRKAYGLSTGSGRFVSENVHLDEELLSLSANANLATLSTSKRLLVFRAPSGSWTTKQRPLR